MKTGLDSEIFLHQGSAEQKSGTLRREKRYFNHRKAVLFGEKSTAFLLLCCKLLDSQRFAGGVLNVQNFLYILAGFEAIV